MSASANFKAKACADASSCPPEGGDAGVVHMAERRWHPALRALTAVALGAAVWVPVVAVGRLIFS
ncbi:hypothetical protein [Sphingomonas sp. SRS2]|uniref:hypothetical protein n=1 Tax=Sphingomonas sp. SRS2 TaxID=133190 RepID=UPI00061846AA|nr:hypothetical protein [Sphingomonas sp. SRS2]KKC27778.1 hypothetical protein WP12_00930 [Sphingomonas sp. SRS2]